MPTKAPAAPPERSLAQRRTALVRANEVREARAEWKRAPRTGTPRLPPTSLIRDPGDDFATMTVFDLLLALPKVGRVKADKWLREVRISQTKTLGGMSDRQRDELATKLEALGYTR